jgi:CRP-like cAMP-binding protein
MMEPQNTNSQRIKRFLELNPHFSHAIVDSKLIFQQVGHFARHPHSHEEFVAFLRGLIRKGPPTQSYRTKHPQTVAKHVESPPIIAHKDDLMRIDLLKKYEDRQLPSFRRVSTAKDFKPSAVSGGFSVDAYIAGYLKELNPPGRVLTLAKPTDSPSVKSSIASISKINVCKDSTLENEIFYLLGLTSFERTKEQKHTLYKYMRQIQAFKELSDFLLYQLCDVLRYQEFKKDIAVISQGEIGSAWYIILRGKCKVLISKDKETVHVTNLGAGVGFGDLALINDKPRTATVVTLTDCEIVSVGKHDYERILKLIHLGERMEKISFLRSIPAIFKNLDQTELNCIGSIMPWRVYQKGNVIQREGEHMAGIVLVKSGICAETSQLKLSNKIVTVKLKMHREGSIFGLKGLLSEAADYVSLL